MLSSQRSITLTVEKYFNVQCEVRHHGKEIFPVGEAINSFHGCLGGTSISYSLRSEPCLLLTSAVRFWGQKSSFCSHRAPVVLLIRDGGGSQPFPRGCQQRALAVCALRLHHWLHGEIISGGASYWIDKPWRGPWIPHS